MIFWPEKPHGALDLVLSSKKKRRELMNMSGILTPSGNQREFSQRARQWCWDHPPSAREINLGTKWQTACVGLILQSRSFLQQDINQGRAHCSAAPPGSSSLVCPLMGLMGSKRTVAMAWWPLARDAQWPWKSGAAVTRSAVGLPCQRPGSRPLLSSEPPPAFAQEAFAVCTHSSCCPGKEWDRRMVLDTVQRCPTSPQGCVHPPQLPRAGAEPWHALDTCFVSPAQRGWPRPHHLPGT